MRPPPSLDPASLRATGDRADAGDGRVLLRGATSAGNAAALRATLADLAPHPLGLATSAGFGDRLGSATPRHSPALRPAVPSPERSPA